MLFGHDIYDFMSFGDVLPYTSVWRGITKVRSHSSSNVDVHYELRPDLDHVPVCHSNYARLIGSWCGPSIYSSLLCFSAYQKSRYSTYTPAEEKEERTGKISSSTIPNTHTSSRSCPHNGRLRMDSSSSFTTN